MPLRHDTGPFVRVSIKTSVLDRRDASRRLVVWRSESKCICKPVSQPPHSLFLFCRLALDLKPDADDGMIEAPIGISLC
jgi:hypothetical protein